MLSNLLGSKARVKILKLFLLNSNESYYIRQIARDLDLQVNSVRRELENLEQFGLLMTNFSTEKKSEDLFNNKKKTKSGDENRLDKIESLEKKASKKESNKQEKKYYQLNKNFVLYNEIKALIAKSQILASKDFIKNLKKIAQPKYLALTGAFVNENFPVDMVIVGKVNKTKFKKIVSDLEKEVGKEINYTIMNQKEFNYRREITDVFIYNVMEAKKMVLIDNLDK